MWGAIIGAALSIGSSIMNGVASSKARKAQKRLLEQRKRENQAWYDRKYYEDPTKRADTQRLLTLMQDQIRDRNRAAKGRQNVMGGTEDSVTATKEANAKAMADTTSQIVANNDARKDKIEEQYQNRKFAIENQQAEQAAQESADQSAAIASALGTASNIAGALDSAGGGKKNAPKATTGQQGGSKDILKGASDAPSVNKDTYNTIADDRRFTV